MHASEWMTLPVISYVTVSVFSLFISDERQKINCQKNSWCGERKGNQKKKVKRVEKGHANQATKAGDELVQVTFTTLNKSMDQRLFQRSKNTKLPESLTDEVSSFADRSQRDLPDLVSRLNKHLAGVRDLDIGSVHTASQNDNVLFLIEVGAAKGQGHLNRECQIGPIGPESCVLHTVLLSRFEMSDSRQDDGPVDGVGVLIDGCGE